MKKLICILLAVAALVAIVTFITLFFTGFTAPSYQDTNGETDFSLQSITDQDILEGTNTIKILSSKLTKNNQTVCKAKTLSGVDELIKVRMQNEPLDLAVSCEIIKGNARLVLIVDDEIIHEFALNEADQHFTLENVTGTVRLKMAGENCGYTVTFEFK